MNNEPLIGATVQVKGKQTGTITNIEGRFSVKVQAKDILVISYMGYTSQEMIASKANGATITLVEDGKTLEEVVVVGYATQKKVNLTGAVSAIDSKIIENRPVSNVVQALQGAVPGLNISNTNGGMMGTNPSISIRGLGTIGQGSSGSPLVLIDGMEAISIHLIRRTWRISLFLRTRLLLPFTVRVHRSVLFLSLIHI